MTSLESAREAVSAAERVVLEWQERVDRARLAAAEHRSGASAAVVSEPGSLGAVGVEVSRLESEAGLAAEALTTAREQLVEARRAALKAAAVEEDRAVDEADREYGRHVERVEQAWRVLEGLEVCEFERLPARLTNDTFGQKSDIRATSRTSKLLETMTGGRIRAAVLRYAAKHGERPVYRHEVGAPKDFYGQLMGREYPELLAEFLPLDREPAVTELAPA